MELNLNILFDSLNSYHTKWLGSDNRTIPIRRACRSWAAELSPKRYCVYVITAQEAAARPHFFTECASIIVDAERSPTATFDGVSGILIETSTPIDQIFEDVQLIFDHYSIWEESVMRTITVQADLQDIVNSCATVLTNPIAIFDKTSALLIHSTPIPDLERGSVWNVVLERKYMPVESLPTDLRNIAQSLNYTLWDTPQFLERSSYTDSETVVVNLRIKDHFNAVIGSVSVISPFTPGQLALLSKVRDLLEYAFKSQTAYSKAINEEDHIYYLDALIKGVDIDERIVQYHLRKRGWSSDGRFQVFHIAGENSETMSDQIDFLLYRIKRISQDCIAFTYENAVNIIVRNADGAKTQSLKDDLSELLPTVNLKCGMSMQFYHFLELKYYYIQAKNALYEGAFINKAIIQYDQVYFHHIYHVLEDNTSIRSICHPAVYTLYKNDQASGSSYVFCLEKYLSTGCNVAQTAGLLFVHRNTLEYRLNKIYSLLGFNPLDCNLDDRMYLWFSCNLLLKRNNSHH